jgi:hypothetical protein
MPAAPACVLLKNPQNEYLTSGVVIGGRFIVFRDRYPCAAGNKVATGLFLMLARKLPISGSGRMAGPLDQANVLPQVELQ